MRKATEDFSERNHKQHPRPSDPAQRGQHSQNHRNHGHDRAMANSCPYLSTTTGVTRPNDLRGGDGRNSSADWEIPRILDDQRTAIKREPVPDTQIGRTFATTVDDIIRGRRVGRRVRPKSGMEKGKPRADRTKPRPEKACVSCEKCGATFASVGNLNRHVRVSHQGRRVYCNYPNCHQVRFLSCPRTFFHSFWAILLAACPGLLFHRDVLYECAVRVNFCFPSTCTCTTAWQISLAAVFTSA